MLNSKLAIKQEIDNIPTDFGSDISSLSRPKFNVAIQERFVSKEYDRQPLVFDAPKDPSANMDFLTERIGIEVCFGHPSFIGIDLIKFQADSHSDVDKIDVGIYIVTPRNFQMQMKIDYKQKWRGSLAYEKVVRYLSHLRSVYTRSHLRNRNNFMKVCMMLDGYQTMEWRDKK